MAQLENARGKVAAVIVAAGRGERAGREGGPKQYRMVGGRPVILWAVERFVSHPEVDIVVVVIHADDIDFFREATGPFAERVTIVTGGPSRQASTRLGLEALDAAKPEVVLIHDGVRPFCDDALISRTIAAISPDNGAIPATAVADTLKLTDETRRVQRTVPRDRLFAAQTPQAFPFGPILAAHRKAMAHGREDFTDDSGIAEFSEVPVFVVEGSPDNVKLTWADDIAHADRKLRASMPAFPDVRSGNGYDVHAFAPGDHVTLCGVAIPHGKTLSGHSDADVGLHALTDALLATCGAGDIGTHFPPSDPQWRGAASRIFVEHAAKLVREAGGRIANADITLICEGPKIAPHREAMTQAISAALGVSGARVSVKATTNEKLGFIGRDEGIAAIATASVVYPGEVPE